MNVTNDVTGDNFTQQLAILKIYQASLYLPREFMGLRRELRRVLAGLDRQGKEGAV